MELLVLEGEPLIVTVVTMEIFFPRHARFSQTIECISAPGEKVPPFMVIIQVQMAENLNPLPTSLRVPLWNAFPNRETQLPSCSTMTIQVRQSRVTH